MSTTAGERIAVDPVRWPDVARVPRAPARAAVAAALLRHAAARLPLRVVLPDGTWLGSREPDAAVMRVHHLDAFLRRVGATGLIGFGESYQAGEWDADDLPGLLRVFAEHVETIVPPRLQWLRRFHGSRQPRAQRNTVDGSRRNIQQHYDLSNDLFSLFLDETMTYSAALFEVDSVGRPIANPDVLAAAQHRKVDRLLDLCRAGPGTNLLEIGTGWGELAIRAARRGARVHTVTISAQQFALATERIRAAGVADRVSVDLRDYRDVPLRGGYDAIISVEMIEAVGQQYWGTYVNRLDELLAPGGRVGLQAITMRHERMLATRDTYTWMQKYVFPGGLIPSVRAIEELCRNQTSLRLLHRHGFGPHYAATLRLWREGFTQRTTQVDALGFDRLFRRTWDLYLAYCEAGFASGYLDVHQLVLGRTS